MPEAAPTPPASELPSAVRRLRVADRDVYLVGTAHVSRRSVDDVLRTLDAVRPEVVAIELDGPRFRHLTDREAWRRLDVFEVIRRGQAMLLLGSLLMTSFQRRVARELGVTPGEEMLVAARWAEERGAGLVLADRDIQVTLKRTLARLGFWTRLKVLLELLAGVVLSPGIDADTVEAIKEEEELGDLLQVMAREHPQLKGTLIDERDVVLAQAIRSAGEAGQTVVAVVGAGHVPGIVASIERETPTAPLCTVPPVRPWGKVLRWTIPGAIVALLVAGFVTGGAERSLESLAVWCVVNGTLSALGAALALGHPLTVLSALLAAPLTSLNPMIAAGWVAGLVQAWVKKPEVRDLEELPDDITTLGGFWRNSVSRILLVVVLANLGSTAGTFLAGSWIAARVFG